MAVFLTSIKRYFTWFWQCSCIDLFFRKRHFRKLVTKSQKHVLIKISSTKIPYNILIYYFNYNILLFYKIPYNIYNIYNRYLNNDARSKSQREGEKSRVGAKILATFLIIILFLAFYVNNKSCSKTKMEYLNKKLDYELRRHSRDRLSRKNYQRVSA